MQYRNEKDQHLQFWIDEEEEILEALPSTPSKEVLVIDSEASTITVSHLGEMKGLMGTGGDVVYVISNEEYSRLAHYFGTEVLRKADIQPGTFMEIEPDLQIVDYGDLIYNDFLSMPERKKIKWYDMFYQKHPEKQKTEAKQSQKIISARMFERRMFSLSGYLPLRIRKKIKNK